MARTTAALPARLAKSGATTMQCGLIIAAVLSALISIVATWRTDLAALRLDLSAELDMATTPMPVPKGGAARPSWPSGSRGNQPGQESRPGHPTR